MSWIINKYISRSKLIYFESDRELWDQINDLKASGEYPISVEYGITPHFTTTKYCARVHFYTQL